MSIEARGRGVNTAAIDVEDVGVDHVVAGLQQMRGETACRSEALDTDRTAVAMPLNA